MRNVLNVKFVVMIGPISWREDGVDDLLFSWWDVRVIELGAVSLMVLFHRFVDLDTGFVFDQRFGGLHWFLIREKVTFVRLRVKKKL